MDSFLVLLVPQRIRGAVGDGMKKQYSIRDIYEQKILGKFECYGFYYSIDVIRCRPDGIVELFVDHYHYPNCKSAIPDLWDINLLSDPDLSMYTKIYDIHCFLQELEDL